MNFLASLRRWFRDPARKLRKLARRDLDALFRERSHLLQSVSLRPAQRGRTQILRVEERPYRILFGILRHPRPYPFSRQHHEVLEIWAYLPDADRVERLEGRNISRLKGEDGSPSSFGAGI